MKNKKKNPKNNRMNIYFKPYSNRIKEQEFFRHISDTVKNVNHIQQIFSLSSTLHQELINRDEIIEALNSDLHLSANRNTLCIAELKKIPRQIYVVESIEKLSIDFVIENKGKYFFIEFHEKQHRRLSDNRLKTIYSKDLEKISVPRFVQRFLRDIWRWKYLDNYKIIWWDWFKKNPESTIDFLSEGKSEFFLENKFSFKNLIE